MQFILNPQENTNAFASTISRKEAPKANQTFYFLLLPQIIIHSLSYCLSFHAIPRLVFLFFKQHVGFFKPFLIWLELKRKQHLCVVIQNTFSPKCHFLFPMFWSLPLWPLYLASYGRGCFCLHYSLVLHRWSTRTFFYLKYLLRFLWLLVLFWTIMSCLTRRQIFTFTVNCDT